MLPNNVLQIVQMYLVSHNVSPSGWEVGLNTFEEKKTKFGKKYLLYTKYLNIPSI